MYAHLKSASRVFTFLLIALLASSCQGGTVSTAAPEQPAETSESTTVTVEPTTVVIPVPQSYIFMEIKEYLITQQDQVFIGTGTVLNENEEPQLVVTATGASEESVKKYFETAKFYFEVREVIQIPVTNEMSIQPFYSSVQELYMDEKVEYLHININLPPDIKTMYPKGNFLVIIDPMIYENQAHHYTFEDPTINGAQANVQSKVGAVEATLYLQGSALLNQTQKRSEEDKQVMYLSGTGEGGYDLVIIGLDRANEYQLTGTWTSIDMPEIQPNFSGNPEDLLIPVDMILPELTFIEGKSVTNADVATQFDDPVEHETRLDNWGRVTGYEHRYKNENICTEKSGISYIYIETILMKDHIGANQYMSWLEEDDKAREDIINFEYIEGLGDAASAIWGDDVDTCEPPNNILWVSIMFRHYNVIGIVTVDSIAGTMSDSELMEVALKVANEIDAKLIEAAK